MIEHGSGSGVGDNDHGDHDDQSNIIKALIRCSYLHQTAACVFRPTLKPQQRQHGNTKQT